MNLFLKKLKGKLVFYYVRTLNIIGFKLPIRQMDVMEYSQTRFKVLLVAHGQIPVPPMGWGAVETICDKMLNIFRENGLHADLLNSKSILDWLKISRNKYNVVILHDDARIIRARRIFRKSKLVLISHYGLLAFPAKWEIGFKKNFENFEKADVLVALSPAIEVLYRSEFPTNKVISFSNGSDMTFSQVEEKKDSLVCLGKIEMRKKQYELAKYCKNEKISIEFIGKIIDERVNVAIKTGELESEMFLGPMNSKEISEILSSYDALVLLSEGEADALVLYEAQFAGIPIIVNQESLGSQNPNLPWVYVVEDISEILTTYSKVLDSKVAKEEIQSYAKKNYSWKDRIQLLINILLQEFN